ncbi:hypothetical protein CFP56_005613 [Quercus suber]|uniref:Uncharacterized protein n=1 Tax=Quercus suber TaxID=58331 RepID=A0AAW0LBI9_QUESU
MELSSKVTATACQETLSPVFLGYM